MQPFSVCNDQSFLILLCALDPKFICPDRKTLAYKLEATLIEDALEFKEIFANLKSKVSLTTDCWKSTAGDPYIVVTCHYIDEDFIL